MLSTQFLHRLEFVNGSFGDHEVCRVNGGKFLVGNIDWKFDSRGSYSSFFDSNCQILLINFFFAQAAQFVLAGKGVRHYCVVQLPKLVLVESPQWMDERDGHRGRKQLVEKWG